MNRVRFGVLSCAVLLSAACEEKKASAPTSASAETPTGPAVDPNLAQAVAAASVAAPTAASPKNEDGPPESGVFAPGKADEMHKKGDAPKIDVGSTGGAPKRQLSLNLPPGSKQTGSIVLTMRAARQMLPPMQFDLSLEAQKPKADDPATPLQVKVTTASLGDMQGQAMPPELQAQIAKLKGSRVDLKVLASGAVTDSRYELPKGADPGLNTVLRTVAESLAVSSVVYPSEPVGVGATWLVTSREFATGADVVSYRMFKLDALTETDMTLSVSTKRYSATNKLTLAGLPPGDLSLEEFQYAATGKATVAVGALFPSESEQNQGLNAVLVPADNPQQRMGVQSQATATLKFPK